MYSLEEKENSERILNRMIPKTIHYCWFGQNKKSGLTQKCIDSWKKCCPDYKIIEWNENNFDVNLNAYTKMCYEQKKFAFLSDYVRLVIVNEHGGIYFDTDVEIVKSFDTFLKYKAFFGFETYKYVNTGLGFGAEPNTEIVKIMLSEYDYLLDGLKGTVGCPRLNTQALLKYGFRLDGQYQKINDIVVFPIDYFNPYDDPTGILKKTDNTYSIHWYGKSWMSKRRIIKSKITKPIHRIFGIELRKRK